MSKRIEEILEVIEIVREEFQNAVQDTAIDHIRVIAAKTVAGWRNIKKNTVGDKFIRQLRPDIWRTSEFDKLLEDWLVHDSDELRNIISKHSVDDKDIELINNAFHIASEPDILVAQEFGYDPNDHHFMEGKLKLRLHLRKERNRSLVNHAKKIWNQEQNGRVCCFICTFCFIERYGDVGKGFIEAHHNQPIESLLPDTAVNISDLVPVCSNCHSMLHRNRPWLTVEQLRSTLQGN